MLVRRFSASYDNTSPFAQVERRRVGRQMSVGRDDILVSALGSDVSVGITVHDDIFHLPLENIVLGKLILRHTRTAVAIIMRFANAHDFKAAKFGYCSNYLSHNEHQVRVAISCLDAMQVGHQKLNFASVFADSFRPDESDRFPHYRRDWIGKQFHCHQATNWEIDRFLLVR